MKYNGWIKPVYRWTLTPDRTWTLIPPRTWTLIHSGPGMMSSTWTWTHEPGLDLVFNPPRTWTLNLPWTWTPCFWFLRAGSAALAIMDSGLSLRRWCWEAFRMTCFHSGQVQSCRRNKQVSHMVRGPVTWGAGGCLKGWRLWRLLPFFCLYRWDSIERTRASTRTRNTDTDLQI